MIMEEINVQTADALWTELGVLHKKSHSERELIYRGHSDSNWDLLPSLFRTESKEQLLHLIGTRWRSEQLTWFEFTNLRNFIYYCDDAGSTIPTDSVRFRKTNLMDESFSNIAPTRKIGQMKTLLIQWHWHSSTVYQQDSWIGRPILMLRLILQQAMH